MKSIVRTLFNLDHPWLIFNIMTATDRACQVLQLSFGVGIFYESVSVVETQSLITSDPHVLISRRTSLKLALIGLLVFGMWRSKLRLAPEMGEELVAKTAVDSFKRGELKLLRNGSPLEKPWLDRYVELTLLLSIFLGPLLVTIRLQQYLYCHSKPIYDLLLGSTCIYTLLEYALQARIALFNRNFFSKTVSYAILHRLVLTEREMVRKERLSSSQGFLKINKQRTDLEYQKLKSATSIRLLKLHSAESTTEQALCEMIEVDVDNSPPYDALSYRWSSALLDEVNGPVIHLSNDKVLRIGHNAYKALQALTPSQGTRCIWVDSISINQMNNEEKSVQIPLMGKIYSNAQNVVVFLGDEYEGQQVAWLLSRTVNFVMMKAPHLIDTTLKKLPIDQDFVRKCGFVIDLHDIAALLKFQQNEYWQRAWIIQECVLAQHITILYGGAMIPWWLMSLSVSILDQWPAVQYAVLGSSGDGIESPGLADMLQSLLYLRVGYINRSMPPFGHLVGQFSHAQATDARDNIYAFLGLYANDKNLQQALQPEYSRSVQDIHIDFVQYSLMQRSFVFLAFSGLTCSGHNEWKMCSSKVTNPSWLPVFQKFPGPTSTYAYHDRINFKAGAEHTPDFNILRDDLILELNGFLVDHVHHVSSDVNLAELSRMRINLPWIEVLARNASRLIEMLDMYRAEVPNHTEWERRKAFWRTVSKDPSITLRISEHQQRQLIEAIETAVESARKELVEKAGWPQEKSAMNPLSLSVLDAYRYYQEGTKYSIHSAQRDKRLAIEHEFFQEMIRHQSFAITEADRLLAAVPIGTRRGDVIAVFKGAPAPCVLRPIAQDDAAGYYFIGEAYVDGIMHGEAMNDSTRFHWLQLH